MERLRGHGQSGDRNGPGNLRELTVGATGCNSGRGHLAGGFPDIGHLVTGTFVNGLSCGSAGGASDYAAPDASSLSSCGFAASRTSVLRQRISFRSVNRRDQPDFQDGLQRHHLLPCQLLGQRGFGTLFNAIGRDRLGFDDFRRNGLLLPANGEAALRTRMPLHRGPHRSYNAMVAERVGQVEAEWSRLRLRAPEIAADQAVMRLELLQRALRRRLLASDRPTYRLNRKDPLGTGLDFSELDAMADALWGGTELVQAG